MSGALRLVVATATAIAALLLLPVAASAARSQYYVSLGDSYAAGYEATGPTTGGLLGHGFADQVPGLARRRGYRLALVNFGCAGATTASILTSPGCRPRGLGSRAKAYAGLTQVAAAERFLRAHRGRVALVSISIGGNDVTSCATVFASNTCVADAVERIDRNVRTLVRRVRRAAGAKVRITGTTYPDVILGQWLRGTESGRRAATLSITGFRTRINPALKAAYATAKGRFVDVTAATGAYGSMDAMTTLAPYGRIPVPVAKVCELTSVCRYGDIHARPAGYRIIARLVAGTLPRR